MLQNERQIIKMRVFPRFDHALERMVKENCGKIRGHHTACAFSFRWTQLIAFAHLLTVIFHLSPF